MEPITKEKTDKKRLTDIVNILTDALHPERIYLFGSRSSGNPKRNSDFDIAVEGSSATFRKKRLAKEKLDEALGIYSFDLVETEKVSPEFKKLIKEKGKLLYERD